jgi:DNA processing protein
MDAKDALIALNMIDHVGPVRLRQLLEHFADPPAILAAGRDRLLRVGGIGLETADSIASWESTVDLQGELRRIREFGCSVVTQLDEEYPPMLREIYDPPVVLYMKGTLLPRDRNGVAMVGSRQTTPYGLEMARRFGYQLGSIGVTVVSGGARGIDTAAHQGALSGKGRTIAVLGTGINRVFPPENADLFERIAGQGAVLTQFAFNRPADRQSFPIRNRIVAGMTLGTLVVEATVTSGAMITANFAIDYGRQVFAIPGRIDSPRSKGCHELIKRGAKLCESAEDVLGEFEYLFPKAGERGLGATSGMLPTLALSEHEQTLLDIIGTEGEHPMDTLIRGSGLPCSTVAVAMLGLEMKRLVRQLPGRLFTRNR